MSIVLRPLPISATRHFLPAPNRVAWIPASSSTISFLWISPCYSLGLTKTSINPCGCATSSINMLHTIIRSVPALAQPQGDKQENLSILKACQTTTTYVHLTECGFNGLSPWREVAIGTMEMMNDGEAVGMLAYQQNHKRSASMADEGRHPPL